MKCLKKQDSEEEKEEDEEKEEEKKEEEEEEESNKVEGVENGVEEEVNGVEEEVKVEPPSNQPLFSLPAEGRDVQFMNPELRISSPSAELRNVFMKYRNPDVVDLMKKNHLDDGGEAMLQWISTEQNLVHCKSLSLSRNRLRILVSHQLPARLVELNLSCNELSGRLDLTALSFLKRLYLNENPDLRKFPLVNSKLECLNLSGCGLSKISRKLLKLKDLQKLWMHGNPISLIPTWIGQLGTGLKILSLFGCSIWRVPLELAQLKGLEELFLRDNSLPPALNRNIVIGSTIQSFFKREVYLYEIVFLLFMIWQRQRRDWEGVYCLGSLPRDVLFYLCGKIDYAPPEKEKARSKRVDREPEPYVHDPIIIEL